MIRALGSVMFVVLLSATAFGQSAPAPTFASADVHPVSSSGLGVDFRSGGVLRAGRYEVRSATMVDLITLAYGVDSDRVLGGPRWLDTDRFDVIAKAPVGATPDAAKLMLQALLADRFALTVHADNKPVAVYVLSMGKSSPKLKAASGSGAPGCQPPSPSAPPAPGTIPTNLVSCHNLNMDVFADTIHQMANGYLDHPVVNQTKLEGEWDFNLSWTPRGALAQAGADGVSIFDAVDKQLGLKLEPQKVPMPVVVVEKVNEKPTANAPGVASSEPDAPVEFDAAEIKPGAPGSQATRFIYQPGGRINGEGTLGQLIAFALGVPLNIRADTLVGLPKFAESERFEIIAKTPSTGAGAATHDGGRDTPPPLSVALLMLQSFMKDRFKLATHTEDRPATVYALVVPKGALKLKRADETERAGCKPDPGAAPVSANATPTIAYRCQNTTMAELAHNVQQWAGGYIDHPAIDATGLQGGWDFVLSWTPKQALHPFPADTAGGVASDPGGLSLFEAIEKELGLKLDVQKHTVPVIVVDHVEEKPTDN